MNLPEKYKDAEQFAFGDSEELANELLALVLEGKKSATSSALRDYGNGGNQEKLPLVGSCDIVLDGKCRPACVIKTTKVTIQKFNAVSEEFALQEGEGNFTEWQKAHIAFFTRNGGFSPDMELVCECFELIEMLS